MKTIKLLLTTLNYTEVKIKKKFEHDGIIYVIVGDSPYYNCVHYPTGGTVFRPFIKANLKTTLELSKTKLIELKKRVGEEKFFEILNSSPIVNY